LRTRSKPIWKTTLLAGLLLSLSLLLTANLSPAQAAGGDEPMQEETEEPTEEPTEESTAEPTDEPTATEEPTEEPTATETPKPTRTPGSVVFTISDWNTDPGDLVDSIQFTLNLTLENIGEADAEEVVVRVGDSTVFTNVGAAAEIGDMDEDDDEDLSLRVGIAPDLSSGYYSIPIVIEYTNDDTDARGSDTQNVGVYVTGEDTDLGQSTFSIDSWSTTPRTLYGGANFTLNLVITNVGESPAQEVLVTIGASNDFVNTGSTQRLGTIDSGASAAVALQVGADDNLGDGYYSIPVEISFGNDSNNGSNRGSETRAIGVYVVGVGDADLTTKFLLADYEVSLPGGADSR
jgi:hypothetical protein